MRVTARAPETQRSYYHLGVQTGNLTGVAADAPVFQLQNSSNDLLVIKRVKVCFTLTTAFTAAQYLDFGLKVERAITVYASGNTLVPFIGSNCRLMSDSSSVANVFCHIATTGAVTTGTRTADTNYMGLSGGWLGAIGANIPLTTIFEATPGRHPITLALGEGIAISPATAMGATGVGILGVNIEFADTLAY
jgi:hypothetical protein